MKINSTGKAVKGEKKKKQEEALSDLKKRSSSRKKDIEKSRKAASEKQSKPKPKEGNSNTAALAGVGGAVLKNVFGKKGKKPKLGMIIIIVAVIAIAFFLFKPQLGGLLSAFSMPDSVAPDEVMGYNSIDFQEAILGESRERSALIVWEQDVEVRSEISSAFGNFDFLKKSKVIHTFGTGKYTVELGGIDNEHITVDETLKTVTITIPHSVLDSVSIDPNNTTFEETEHNLPIKLGDIKMTQEQQNELDKSIDGVLREKLNIAEHFAKADDVAIYNIQEIFQPLVTAVSDQYEVVVVQE